jgi:hypothetical protein
MSDACSTYDGDSKYIQIYQTEILQWGYNLREGRVNCKIILK